MRTATCRSATVSTVARVASAAALTLAAASASFGLGGCVAGEIDAPEVEDEAYAATCSTAEEPGAIDGTGLLTPVSRTVALTKTFEPATAAVPAGYLFSSQSARPLAVGYFVAMANAARRDLGRDLGIGSSYRSFCTQAGLFQTFVAQERAGGVSQTEAERRANIYSARAGHSEHQLGTAIDILDLDTGAFLTGPASDPRLQEWLRLNAWKFGWVNSYPPNADDRSPTDSATFRYTGYMVEPWHWRFIGRRAAEAHHVREGLVGRRLSTHEWIDMVRATGADVAALEQPHADDAIYEACKTGRCDVTGAAAIATEIPEESAAGAWSCASSAWNGQQLWTCDGAGSLNRCDAAGEVETVRCPGACTTAAVGTADSCAWSCSASEWAGEQFWTCSGGNLFRCGASGVEMRTCAAGCAAGPAGTDDACL